ncbi:hypothetical protein T492DRAFT_849170 [Pavlovales sp. CCMP2436]|nr:hypothetical protein T492DRAFT_849170 [Pavlovales sp. CCMP2436]
MAGATEAQRSAHARKLAAISCDRERLSELVNCGGADALLSRIATLQQKNWDSRAVIGSDEAEAASKAPSEATGPETDSPPHPLPPQHTHTHTHTHTLQLPSPGAGSGGGGSDESKAASKAPTPKAPASSNLNSNSKAALRFEEVDDEADDESSGKLPGDISKVAQGPAGAGSDSGTLSKGVMGALGSAAVLGPCVEALCSLLAAATPMPAELKGAAGFEAADEKASALLRAKALATLSAEQVTKLAHAVLTAAETSGALSPDVPLALRALTVIFFFVSLSFLSLSFSLVHNHPHPEHSFPHSQHHLRRRWWGTQTGSGSKSMAEALGLVYLTRRPFGCR